MTTGVVRRYFWGGGHGVETRRAPGMASRQSTHRQPAPPHGAMLSQRLQCIVGTRWHMSTIPPAAIKDPQEWCEEPLVDNHNAHQQPSHASLAGERYHRFPVAPELHLIRGRNATQV